MRTRPPMRSGCSTVFGELNAGKKSLVLDLKSRGWRRSGAAVGEISGRLRGEFPARRDAAAEVRLRALSALNPKLIYCSISGYGQTGPSAELPAYAPVIHAASGYDMAHLAYQPGRERPDYCGIYHADVFAGTYAFGAISAALYQRTLTKTGQHIDVSMLEAMLMLTLNEVQWSQFAVPPLSRPMFGPIGTSDGYVMLAIASEKTFQGLIKVIGHPEWVSDPRFVSYADRRNNWSALMDGVEAWSRTLTTAKCLEALNGAGVPSSAYRTLAEALADPQLAHRRALAEVEDNGGKFRVMNLPFRMSGAKVAAGKRVSTLGEHTARALEGDRLLRTANRGVFRETACRRGHLTSVLPLAPIRPM